MKKINRLIVKDFKFFHGEVKFEFEGKNVLVYGENGSGKSSLYWALYTLLQSSLKTSDPEISKYFDPRHDENLVNRYSNGATNGFIELEYIENHASATRRISRDTINTKVDSLVLEACLGSEFLDYKILSRIHSFYHKEEIDLFEYFQFNLFPFINFSRQTKKAGDPNGSANANYWWDVIKGGINPKPRTMRDFVYIEFQRVVGIFNEEFGLYIDRIAHNANQLLTGILKEKFQISLKYRPANYNPKWPGTQSRSWKMFPPSIILSITLPAEATIRQEDRRVMNPQSYLNEARLTSLALSLRFAVMDDRFVSAYPKLLVLDDLLLSMDMSSRGKILDLILNRYGSDYQIFALTHDRQFFELFRHQIKVLCLEDWKQIEMYEVEKAGIPQPFIKVSDDYLTKAEYYFQIKEYEVAGNMLRKEAEAFCLEFLPKKYHYTAEFNRRDLNGLILECANFAKRSGLDPIPFALLNSHRKFVLNPSSHDSYDVPKFNGEVGKCLNTLKTLRQIKNEPFLMRGTKLEFELVDKNGTDLYKFEISLEDDFRLLKEPGKGSLISIGMVNYWISKNGAKGELQHGVESLKAMYDKCFSKSDNSKNSDFWEEIVNVNGENLSKARKF